MNWEGSIEKNMSIQQRAFYCKQWDACLDDWIVSKKADDNIYLKGIVWTGGKSMVD